MEQPEQDLISSEAMKLEDDIWAYEKTLDQAGMDCNAQGPCDKGEVGNMTAIIPSAEDQKMLEDIAINVVVKRWAKRCGAACVAEWNDTIGKAIGVTASAE